MKNMTRSAEGTVDAPGHNVRQKAGLNRAILDNAPYERRRQLAYKAPRFGSELRVVPAPGTSATALGVTDPRTWGAAGWVSDLLPHLAYGLATATVYEALADRTLVDRTLQ